ncbi:MAG: glycosyltransferase [Chryseobacterium sp.]|nr:MAG: glycosyltransferase [Chryseobacterium sp.]
MKILQVINSLATGGAEKLLLETLPLYAERGIQMDLLLLWDNNHTGFVQELRKLDCRKIYILKTSGHMRDIYNPGAILKMRRIFRDYDLIHVHLFPAQYFAAVANIGLGKKLIFTEHSTTNRRHSNKLYRLPERWCYARYDRLVCITNEIDEIYKEYLPLGTVRQTVINNGVNLDRIRKAVPYRKHRIGQGMREDDILLLQVAAFRQGKDQDTLIRALTHLPENFKLLLAGDGVRRPELEKLVDDLQLNGRVCFLGERMDIPELLRSVDIVVLSSYYEGLSLASVEGLISGKPFLASDVPGLRDIVGGAGLLFERGNDKQLAELILKLEKDREFAEETVRNSTARAENYDINRMVDKHIELYREVYAEG